MAAPCPLTLIQVHLHPLQPGKPVLERPRQEQNTFAFSFQAGKGSEYVGSSLSVIGRKQDLNVPSHSRSSE